MDILDILLSPETTVGTIVLTFVAAGLAWVGRRSLPQLVGLVRRALGPTPRLRRALRIGADKLYPNWRITAGQTRLNHTLAWRLGEVRRLKRPPFVIIGGLYLDIHISPIDVDQLDGSEYGNLDTVRMECGGSAYFVGRHLAHHHGKRSHIFSRLGSGDPLSETLRALLRRERWIEDIQLTRVPGQQCGVSVHLLQRNGFHTTFTHKGALASLTWDPLLRKLKRITKRGGVLYISGYFRTGLCTNLAYTLRQLSPKLLICVDHGRFRKEENPEAAAALADALGDLIDVYICTYPEIRELMAATGLEVDETTDPQAALKQFCSQRRLPPVTIVRGGVESPEVYLILENAVERIPATGKRPVPRDHPGVKNAFNAELVYALSHGDVDSDLSANVRTAINQALAAWFRYT